MDSYNISIDHDRSLVQVTVTGNLFQADGEKIITNARKTAAQYDYEILYDVRQATPKIPLSRWFHLPRELEVFKDTKTRNVRAAILISDGEHVDTYDFYELVAKNVGLKVNIFFSEDEALAWLKQNPPADKPV